MAGVIQANEIYFNNMDNGFLKREGGHEGGPSLLIDWGVLWGR